jgi:hypothetical protein
MPSRVLKSGLAVAAIVLLAACGVRGAPSVPPPLFGDTDMPPGVPQPYPMGATPALPASIPPQPPGEPGEND